VDSKVHTSPIAHFPQDIRFLVYSDIDETFTLFTQLLTPSYLHKRQKMSKQGSNPAAWLPLAKQVQSAHATSASRPIEAEGNECGAERSKKAGELAMNVL
jgi:hypothetical protein